MAKTRLRAEGQVSTRHHTEYSITVDVRPAVSSTVCLCLFGMSSCGRDMQHIKGPLQNESRRVLVRFFLISEYKW